MVVVGPSSTVIIADPSATTASSGVWSDQEFRLVGPTPATVTSRLMGPLPFTGAGTSPQPPVHLFVRLDGSCLYLGTIQVSWCEASEDVLLRCHLRINPPLSREVLDWVRPTATAPPLPAVDWLGDVQTNTGQALKRFLTNWYPTTHPQEPVASVPDPACVARRSGVGQSSVCPRINASSRHYAGDDPLAMLWMRAGMSESSASRAVARSRSIRESHCRCGEQGPRFDDHRSRGPAPSVVECVEVPAQQVADVFAAPFGRQR
ncbi:hypothetical protein STANM337S_04085 [Streptomyces tanashiensis]